MTDTLRSLRAPLAIVLLQLLSGCEDSPSPSTPDAGPYVWDGTYTELEDPGDWQDPGPLAPCSSSAVAAQQGACDDLSLFDVSQCDSQALSAIPPEGIYLSDGRGERQLADGGVGIVSVPIGFLLKEDGGTMYDEPLRFKETQGGRFSLIGRLTRTDLTVSMVGCKTPAPNVITGCFAYCRRGRLSLKGTFEAHRVALSTGEPESSGGLNLVSERFVPVGLPADIYVAKGHAYVVSLPDKGRAGGLTVIDVRTPTAPVVTTTITLPEDNSWNGVWAKGDALYVASNGTGPIVYDISNPALPTFVKSLPTGDFGAHTVLVDNDRLYAMVPNTGTHVYDLTEPLNPVLRTIISLPEDAELGGPHDAFAYENRLYISSSFGGYNVVDVTHLDNVSRLGRYERSMDEYAHHSAVGTFGGKTIAFEGGEFNASHVRVLDVTDPSRIVKIGEFRMRKVTSMHNLILRGNLLYVAWYHEGLRVLDVSNPTKPRQVAHHHTFRESDPFRGDSIFEGAFGVRIPGDGYVYVVDSSRGLLIFNEL
ncbi:LVIVD repeat-containing protein [Myxococcus qinghaiensis]|uniref:LVIVD repeat-containing protein n=1 Tax=Myxococcus qinghaiensis TaxID=2906758 RepID=UPI0020A7A791|nr:hypothetical protein [Myxococcus qinghaiensis]MCP3168536.1 hypothetical protein [Myxococcus qinghaiensis]